MTTSHADTAPQTQRLSALRALARLLPRSRSPPCPSHRRALRRSRRGRHQPAHPARAPVRDRRSAHLGQRGLPLGGLRRARARWARRCSSSCAAPSCLTPAAAVEYSVRQAFYRRLQRLQVAFHDRWQSGQLLSRMMQDIGLIRRWLAFGSILLVINVTHPGPRHGAAVPLALGAGRRLRRLQHPDLGQLPLRAALRRAHPHQPRTRRATSRPRSGRACTASGC